MRPLDINKLTSREHDIVVLAQSGRTNRQIADQLGISRRTVEGHLQSVYKTLRLKDNQTARGKLGRSEGNGKTS
jgi:DNA-binding NarL/FixJ family response regulator